MLNGLLGNMDSVCIMVINSELKNKDKSCNYVVFLQNLEIFKSSDLPFFQYNITITIFFLLQMTSGDPKHKIFLKLVL